MDKKFNLIEGEFDQIEAREILVQLFNDKINFHVRKSFSSNIRFGIKDENSERRIKSLQGELLKINDFFKQAEANNSIYRINASIELIAQESKKTEV
ncbi:hypothetical protein MM213_01320 [Belliella sp. R4-6]|uniref:Uncharacterized protein n=1 Tax=Belliella alkalica TaxID=1730871 RepID=A0ABS9V6R0_9BACT|nr:hypothetical protein [Belliella alkalica]MCH7412107.1 hypothetical protein [Belliella alkalica]